MYQDKDLPVVRKKGREKEKQGGGDGRWVIKGPRDEITECVHVPCYPASYREPSHHFLVSSHVAIIMTIFRRYSAARQGRGIDLRFSTNP